MSLTLNSWCQDTQKPPSSIAADKGKKLLVEELMKASRYEEFFREYCYEKIDEKAKKMKWNAELIKERKMTVNFNDFKKLTIYDELSLIPSEQLENLINVFKQVNNKNVSPFFITSSIIQSNLETFVERYLGKE